MATVSRAETIQIRLEQQISGPADVATGALGRLERQIEREQAALGRMQQALGEARGKLEAIAKGGVDTKAVAAYQKQAQVVDGLSSRLGRLKAAGDESTGALEAKLASATAKMQQLKQSSQSASVDVAAYRKQADAVAKLEAKVGTQKDKIGALAEKHAQLEAKGKKTAASQSKLSETVDLLGSKFGVTNSKAFELSKSLLSLGPAGAIVAASLLVVAGAVGVVVGLFSKAMAASAQMRGEFMKLQASTVTSAGAMGWLMNSTRESSLAAQRMSESIDRVSASSGAGREKLADYASQIMQARFSGKQAETVLRAMSTAGAGGFDERAKEVLGMAKMMRFAGGSVDALAQRVEQKLGKTAREAAMTLDAQMKRLGSNITWIFGGADFKPLLKAMNAVLSLFNAGGKEASSMREMVTKMVEFGINKILRMTIVVLDLYIALKSNKSLWSAITGYVKVAAVAFLGAAAVITGLIAAIAAIGPVTVVSLSIFRSWVIEKLGELPKAISATLGEWKTIGARFIDGLVEGIKSKAGAVLEAMKSVIGNLIGGTEKQLEVHSPSRVTQRIGGHVGGGLAGGIRRSEPTVTGAAQHVTASMIAATRESANDNHRPQMFAPQIAAAVGTGAPMGPRAMVAPSAGNQGGKRVEFNNCTFGAVSQAQIHQWVLGALEESELEARQAS